MNAPLARLYSSAQMRQEIAPDERRREQRHAIHHSARVQSAQGEHIEARLTDISLHGCCLSAKADWLRLGAFVSITIREGNSLKGVVRWVRGDVAGMEFLHAVPAAAQEWHDLMDIAD